MSEMSNNFKPVYPGQELFADLDATDFTSGIYYCVLRAGGNLVQTRKMVVLK